MGYQWYKLYSMATYGNPQKKIEKWKQEGIDDLFLIIDSSTLPARIDKVIGTEKLAVWSGTLWQSKLANQSCTHWFGSSCLMMFIFSNGHVTTSMFDQIQLARHLFLHQLHWAVMLGFEHKVAPYPMAYSLLESHFFVKLARNRDLVPFWTTPGLHFGQRSPGVIREIVNMLWAYGVRKIYGIKGGYKGVMEPETWPPGWWFHFAGWWRWECGDDLDLF